MKHTTLIMTTLAIALALTVSTSARPAETWIGTIMCHVSSHPQQYSRVCRTPGDKYVFLTKDAAYDIKHQAFSGLSQLSGTDVRVVGLLKGRVVEILQIEQIPRDDEDVAYP